VRGGSNGNAKHIGKLAAYVLEVDRAPPRPLGNSKPLFARVWKSAPVAFLIVRRLCLCHYWKLPVTVNALRVAFEVLTRFNCVLSRPVMKRSFSRAGNKV
jgi:hypothetical protein